MNPHPHPLERLLLYVVSVVEVTSHHPSYPIIMNSLNLEGLLL